MEKYYLGLFIFLFLTSLFIRLKIKRKRALLKEEKKTNYKENREVTAVINCSSKYIVKHEKYKFGERKTCADAVMYFNGPQTCFYGCIGFGDCLQVCPADAIVKKNNRIVIEHKKCIGCGNCEEACPKNLISLLIKPKTVYAACSSKDKGKYSVQICSESCTACGICTFSCYDQAITIEDNLAVINYSLCTNCGICTAKCTTNALKDVIPFRPKVAIGTKCIGCGACAEICPTNAVIGKKNEKHSVDRKKCIGCGLCLKHCPVNAINVQGALGALKIR